MMRQRGSRTLFLLLSVLFLLSGSTPASSQDTAAVAINTKDGFDVFRLAFRIHRTMSEVVDNNNAAVAFASCTECQTVALSIQTVLVMGESSELTSENLALALNVECVLCETLASAYQFILSTGGPVHFTAEGNKQIAEIRNKLRQLRDSGMSIEQMQEQVDLLMGEFHQVLKTELVPAGPPEDGNAPAATGSPTPAPSSSIEPSPSSSPGTAISPSPSSSPGTAISPSPSQSP